MKKRMLALFLSVAMGVSFMPSVALATEPTDMTQEDAAEEEALIAEASQVVGEFIEESMNSVVNPGQVVSYQVYLPYHVPAFQDVHIP